MNKKEGSSQSQQFLITIICVLGLTFMLFRVNILAHSVFLYRIEYLCAIRQLIIWVCNETLGPGQQQRINNNLRIRKNPECYH